MSSRIKILKWSGIALAILGVLIGLAVAFLANLDWNHAKPWINRRISQATGREFAIHGNLSVAWQHPPQSVSGWRGWIPWPHVIAQDITLGNPDWVKGTSSMAKMRQVSFTLQTLPLLRKHLIIPELAVDTPRLSLLREIDGRNNWTFKNKDNAPPSWQYELDRVSLNKGWLHLVDAVKKIDMNANIESHTDRGGEAYGISWNLNGSINGEKLSGDGKAGKILSLQKKTTPFPVQATLQAGKTAISAKGTLTNPQALAALDLQLHMSGPSLDNLYPILGILLPQTPAYSTEGHLTGMLNALGGNWTYDKFKGKVGSSDISGTLEYLSRESRPLLKGSVVSTLLNFQDLAPLIGADSNAKKVQRGAAPVQPPSKVLPVEEFKTERWTSIDADVQFSGRKIIRKKQLPIDNLVTHIQLNNGVLTLEPLNFGMAGGKLTSNLTLNGRDKLVKAEMKMAARHLQLKLLFPTVQKMHASLGEINGDASLTATGNSVAALLAASNGELKAVIDQGTISKLLLEEMGLNIGNIILSKLFGDEQVDMNCLASDFKIAKGMMHTRLFVMDTKDATLYITGQIDLAQERLDLTLHPESKGVRVFSLRSPLYVAGTFKNPDIKVDKETLALKAGSAITLGVIAPVVTALLPLVNTGQEKKSECATFLTQVTKKPVAPPPGKTAASQ
ncbi:MAG TPA: AsmA family protein [Burkholderiaceae bacterium]|nr:AsmA family protein [Burkholderiaceae bacterium]